MMLNLRAETVETGVASEANCYTGSGLYFYGNTHRVSIAPEVQEDRKSVLSLGGFGRTRKKSTGWRTSIVIEIGPDSLPEECFIENDGGEALRRIRDMQACV